MGKRARCRIPPAAIQPRALLNQPAASTNDSKPSASRQPARKHAATTALSTPRQAPTPNDTNQTPITSPLTIPAAETVTTTRLPANPG